MPLFGDDPGRPGDRFRPAVDVLETEKAWLVRVAVAGVRNRDLRVSLEGDVLCVRGEREHAPPGEEILRHHQLEIEHGPFEARVRIPGAIDRQTVEARLEDGVLTVRMSKQAPRRIEVEREGDEGS